MTVSQGQSGTRRLRRRIEQIASAQPRLEQNPKGSPRGKEQDRGDRDERRCRRGDGERRHRQTTAQMSEGERGYRQRGDGEREYRQRQAEAHKERGSDRERGRGQQQGHLNELSLALKGLERERRPRTTERRFEEPERGERRRRRHTESGGERQEPSATEPPLDSWVEHAIDKYMQRHHPKQREAGMVNVDQLMGFLDKYSKYKREKRRMRKAAEAAQSLAAAQSPSRSYSATSSHADRRVRGAEAWAAPGAASAPQGWSDQPRDRYDGHRREDSDQRAREERDRGARAQDGNRRREGNGSGRERRERHEAISVDIARKMEREWASRRGEARENIDSYVDRCVDDAIDRHLKRSRRPERPR